MPGSFSSARNSLTNYRIAHRICSFLFSFFNAATKLPWTTKVAAKVPGWTTHIYFLTDTTVCGTEKRSLKSNRSFNVVSPRQHHKLPSIRTHWTEENFAVAENRDCCLRNSSPSTVETFQKALIALTKFTIESTLSAFETYFPCNSHRFIEKLISLIYINFNLIIFSRSE